MSALGVLALLAACAAGGWALGSAWACAEWMQQAEQICAFRNGTLPADEAVMLEEIR